MLEINLWPKYSIQYSILKEGTVVRPLVITDLEFLDIFAFSVTSKYIMKGFKSTFYQNQVLLFKNQV